MLAMKRGGVSVRGRLGGAAQRGAVALAAAVLCSAWSLPQAAVVATGSNWTGGNLLGPGDTVLPGSFVSIGGAGVGGLTVDAGSLLSTGGLAFGSGGTGVGTGLINGTGTRVLITGDGERFWVGNWGQGQLTVSGGALLDTSGNQAPCLVAFHYCDSFVGGAAGDTALLNIDGAGTRVRIGQNLFVAIPGLAVQNLDGYTFGVPGGTTRGTVNVTNGAALVADRATIAPRHWSTHQTGHEYGIGQVNVSGAGSLWELVGGNQVNHANGVVTNNGASVITANDPNSIATISVRDGAEMRITGVEGVYNYVNLSNGGGRTDMAVTGAGSKLSFTGDAAILQVGASLGSAALSFSEGATASGIWYLAVGRRGSTGVLNLDGSGTVVTVDGLASATANGSAQTSVIDIGRAGGTGTVNVTGGARLQLLATEWRTAGTIMNLGRDAASAGTLNITGSGSQVLLSAASVLAGGGPGEALNPRLVVGRESSGFLNITAGGKLLLDGQAISTAADSRGTSLFIGGFSDTLAGGRGLATVSGAGSEIRVTGSDAYIGIGHGPQTFGQLSLSDQAQASATNMVVGRSGGVGVLAMDKATLLLSGQQTGSNLSGAALSIGRSGGTGVANIGNGSTVTIANSGSAGASLNLGGTGPGPLGDGTLTLSGGSTIRIQAAPGLATLSIARDGSGLMRMKGASTVDVGDGSVHVGRLKGSDGTLLMSEGSTLNAGWIGIGRTKTATGDADGGTGTLLVLGAGTTVNAQTLVVGSNGFLGGTGTINGNVINYGTFSPGNSPGTITLNGDYVAEAGSRMILEVESDGHGGFNTDHVIFAAGKSVNLSGLAIEFRFLGATDPNAFNAQAGRFDIDNFLVQSDGHGGTVALADSAYASVSFGARAEQYTFSSFQYSAAGGVSFSATAAVPEPGTWAMMAGGLLALARLSRRRRG